MPLRFAIPRPDGGLSILTAAPKEHLERLLGKLSEEEYRAHVVERNDLPADAIELPADWTPPDRTFRDAWTLNGRRIGVDMDKARSVHLARIRRARDQKLRSLDPAWMRATGQKDEEGAAAIEAERQALRDIPQTIDLSKAQTPEELKGIWPEALVTRPERNNE